MQDRPYPRPARPWIMHQRWHDLLFAHWPVSAESLRPLVPRSLELDRFESECWLGIVPFWMSNVRPRGVPPVPGLSRFLELNVRTYVLHRGKPGVFFFSLDASNRIAVRLARTFFHLPYFDAEMKMTVAAPPGPHAPGAPEPLPSFRFESRRTHRGAPPAALRLRYRPTAAPPPGETEARAEANSLARWLTARYCLYTTRPDGALFCGEIHHDPWPLQPAEAEIEENTMAQAAGLSLPNTSPLLHFSSRLDVQIWPLATCAL